ncbi:MAG: glycosyltransferase family 39 protein [Rubrobacter sp.]|nr:glycosyltransferase family 39 protein [Rubrobacter sp.]MDQ3362823.1 glycosyltransferase family 39 protein [Actinomycetota bacterium]
MPVFLRERWELVALGAVMVLGGFLRFYGLGIQSLWSDELASWYFSRSDGVLQVVRNVREDIHPPGYFVMLHFAQGLFGDSEWALRLPSAIAGWLSVPAIYLLGRRVYSGREGLIAALLVAVSWTGVYFSQETRSYSVLILLSIVTAFLWWNVMGGLREERRLPKAETVAYVLAAILCAYAHYFGALLVALQGVALMLLAYRAFPKIALVYVPVSLAYALWLPGMAYQMRNSTAQGAWIGDATLSIFPTYIKFIFGRSELLALAACALFVLLLVRAWGFFQTPREKGSGFPAGLLLFAWLVGPFVVGYALSQTSVQLLTHKNLLVSLPAAYLLVARGITGVLPNRTAGNVLQWSLALGFAAACLFNLLFTADYYSTPNKEQLRASATYINQNETPETLLVRCDIDDRLDYYLGDGEPGVRRDADACTEEDFPALMDRVEKDGYREVFYFMSHKQPTPELVSRMKAEFDLVGYRPFYRTWVAVYRVDGTPQGSSRGAEDA